MKNQCIDCLQCFRSKKTLVTHHAHDSCTPVERKLFAKKISQDNAIQFTQSTKEYSKRLSAMASSIGVAAPNLLQTIPSLKILGKRNFNDSDEIFGTDIHSDVNEDSKPQATQSLTSENHFKSMKCGIPDTLKAQIHLLTILGEHPSNLKLHDAICKWLTYHGHNSEINFKEAKWFSCKSIIGKLTKLLSVYGMEPRDREVRMSSSNTYVTVPTFDFGSMLKSLIHDRELMHHDNFIPDFDIFSGTVTKIGPEVCGDIHTGDLYKEAKERYCKKDNDFPLPFIIFYDKTHTDLHGSLATSPVMFTLGLFSQQARNSVDFWRVLGLVPNLSHGKGKHHDAPSREKLQDQHNCLKVIFESISQISTDGGLPMTILGREVKVQPWIHVIIGDASGNNELCGHFNVHGNCKRPYRDCKCNFDDLEEADPQCEYVTEKEVRVAFEKDKSGSISEISRHFVKNAFDTKNIRMSDKKHGINGCTPPEGLHTFGSGIYSRILETTHDIIGLDKTNATAKDAIDTLHQQVVISIKRQSERDFPRPSNRNGIMDGTKMGDTERRGNLVALVLALMTKRGKTLFDVHCKKHGLSIHQMMRTVSMLLACEKWCHQNNLREEVDRADVAFVDMKKMLLKNFPRRKFLGDGRASRGNAWKLPKFHALSKFPRYMRKFGSATNFNSGPGGTNHKKIVKKPAQQTQRRQVSFTSQVALRNFETALVEMAYSTIREDVGDFDLESDDEELDTITTEGRYRINLHAPANIRMPSDRTFDVVWDWKAKKKLQHHVNKEMVGAVSKNMSDNGYKKKFSIRGYTCAKINHAGGKLLLRCAPTYRGYEWYDFCMVKYNESDESPAKILGFFQYETTGIPTPELVDQGHTIKDVASQNMTDFTLYAVVRSAKKYLSYHEIASKFTTTFELGIGQEYLYILNAESILGPLLAVQNFDGNNNEYVTAAPYRDWGKYFSKFIEESNE